MPETGTKPDDPFRVVDRPEADRYEALLADDLVGFSEYRVLHGRLAFLHTEVDDRYEGRGFGRRLAKAALDDVRARGLKVTPICPFIAAYIKRHPEYDDLVWWGRHGAVGNGTERN